jgi:hypothetical protein
MPALALFGTGIYTLRYYLFQPRAQIPGASTLHFRLILSDVERSLLLLQEAMKHQQQRDLTTNNQEKQSKKSKQQPSSTILITSGTYYFNLARLRSKFHELFDVIASSKSPTNEITALPKVRSTFQTFFKVWYMNISRLFFDENPHPPVTPLVNNNNSTTSALSGNVSPLPSTRTTTTNTLPTHSMKRNLSFNQTIQTLIDKHQPSGSIHSVLMNSSVVPSNNNHHNHNHNQYYHWQLWRHYELLIQNIYDMIIAIKETYFIGPLERVSTTTVYQSLQRDLLLLESPESEVSVESKLILIRNMRLTYKCFSPLM